VSFLPVADDLPGKGIGHFFGAMRIDAFRPATDFKQHMDHWIERFKNAQPIAGEKRVLIPGDPEREMEQERLINGIPLIDAVVEDIQQLALQMDTNTKFH
jgi:LDH2 family malate/lactate/ureidoglycolate dehydrogenase